MTFTVRWPDGRVEDCYSPSLVVHDHLQPGPYTVEDFTARATHALRLASDRVKAKYGMACLSARETTDQIARSAARYDRADEVEVLRLHPPLPSLPQGAP